MEVMSTEQPCDVAYEFGDGLLDPLKIPAHFPKPGKRTICGTKAVSCGLCEDLSCVYFLLSILFSY